MSKILPQRLIFLQKIKNDDKKIFALKLCFLPRFLYLGRTEKSDSFDKYVLSLQFQTN